MANLANLTKIILISTLISSIVCEFQCNNASLEVMDINMCKILNVGKHSRNFPVENSEVGQFCDERNEYIKEVEEYKNHCMKKMPKQMTSLIIYAIRKMINSLCRKNSKRLTRLLNGAPCANTAQLDYTKCMNKYIDSLQGTIYEPDKRKIPHTCCEFYKFYECMRTTAKQYPICTEDKIEANVEYAYDIFTDMLNVLCGDWTEDSDKCERLPPPMKKRKGDKRTASFLMPFIKVFDSFPEV